MPGHKLDCDFHVFCLIYRRVVLVAVALAQLLFGTEAGHAQSSARTVAEEFKARAAERADRGPQKPLDLPDFSVPAPSADGAQFKLTKIKLEGAKSISRHEMEDAYRRYLGRDVSQADLAEITNALGEIYRRRGFALTRAFVPPQDVQGGELTITILEGYVEDVAIEGLGSDWFIAREVVQGMTAERPTRLATLERHMMLLGDLPGIRIVDSSLQEIGTATGRFRLTVRAEFKRAIANVDTDNRGARDIGTWQSFNAVAFNSAVRPGDVLGLNIATIPTAPQRLSYIGSFYEIPIGADGIRLGIRAAYSTSQPAGLRGTIDTHTTSQDYSVYASATPVRTRDLSLRFGASLGLREAEETNIGGLYYQDHIRAGALSADLVANDSLKGTNYLSLTYRKGIAAWASTDRDPVASRPDAPSDFHKVNVTYTRLQALAGPFSMLVSASAQAASSPMFKSEAFYFGGSTFGRAFAAGTLLGDSGIAGLAELRFDQTVNRRLLQSYQLYAFADAGALWTRGGDFQRASSYGAGVRLRLSEDLRAGFEVAVPGDVSAIAPVEQGTRYVLSLSRTFKSCERLWCE